MEGLCESWGYGAANSTVSLAGTAGAGGPLRALAFSVFSGSRRLLQHAPNGKSLTGFGTAANANLFINDKDVRILRIMNTVEFLVFAISQVVNETIFL